MAALLLAGWGFASAFQSPDQIAAAASPPPPSVITVSVTQGTLAETLNVEGEVRAGDQTSAPLSGVGEGGSVVTATPVAAGGHVSAGEVLVEINAQPVFVVPGSFPFFRDLRRGDSGRDVEQLQRALTAAGYSTEADGQFGSATESSLTALYAAHGYKAPTEQVTEQKTTTEPTAPPVTTPAAPKEQPVAVAHAFVVTTTLPATVVSSPGVGTLPDDSSVTFAKGAPAVSAFVIEATAAQLEVGFAARATIKDQDTPLVLQSIGVPDDEGQITLIFVGEGAAIADAAIGEQTVLTVTRSIVETDALLVPSRAIASRGTLRYVLLELSNGTFQEIPVKELGELNGTSAVQPIDEDSLALGDLVRVQ